MNELGVLFRFLTFCKYQALKCTFILNESKNISLTLPKKKRK